MTDFFVRQAQAVFAEVNTSTKGNNGYVSFELDPLLEDASCKLSVRRKGGDVMSSWGRNGRPAIPTA